MIYYDRYFFIALNSIDYHIRASQHLQQLLDCAIDVVHVNADTAKKIGYHRHRFLHIFG